MKKLMQGFIFALLTFVIGLNLVAICSRPWMTTKNRETVLRQNLRELRQAIERYKLEEQKSPSSLDDLIKQGYIRKIPPG